MHARDFRADAPLRADGKALRGAVKVLNANRRRKALAEAVSKLGAKRVPILGDVVYDLGKIAGAMMVAYATHF